MAVAPEALPTTLGGYFRRYAKSYALGALLIVCFQLAMNRIFWLSRSTVDLIFAPNATRNAALVPGVTMILLGAVCFVLRVVSRWLFFSAGRDVEYELRGQLLHKIHRLGQSFYRVMSTGDVMSRATNDLGQVRMLCDFGALSLVNVVFGAAAAFQIMIAISVKLTLASLVNIPFIYLATSSFSRRMFALGRVVQQELSSLADLAQRHFAGIRLVRSFAIEGFAESRFGKATMRYLDVALEMARVRGAAFPVLMGFTGAGMLIVAWYGSSLLRLGPAHGGISDGDLFAFMLAWSRMTAPIISIGVVIATVARGRVCFARIAEILRLEPELAEPSAAERPAVEPTGLSVQRLSYSSSGREILHDIGFEVPAGRSLAIVGRTGSGKSTLAQLIVRLLPVARGSVFLDGRDVLDVPRQALRDRIGYAQQDPFLFSTSVADNVSIGLDLAAGQRIDARELADALRDAQIADEVAQLPHGTDTLVGERGLQLSGGQRQRIALARALVSRSPLLVLDDPLSAVDARTESLILEALRRRGEGRSIILITNRVAAAARCDRVLVLDRGRRAEEGTHAELVKGGGLYATLAEEQRVAEALEALGTPDVAEATVDAKVASVRGPERDDVAESRDLRLLSRLWPFLREQRGAFIAAFALLAAMTGLRVLLPTALGNLITAATHAGSLRHAGLAYLSLLVVLSIVTFFQTYITQVAGTRAMASLRMYVFRFTDRLGMRLFDRTAVGRLVTRVANDIEGIGELFAGGVLNAVGDLASLGFIVFLMLAIDYKLALIALSSAPVLVVIAAIVRGPGRRAYRDVRTTIAQLNATLNEQLSGVAVVQAFGREEVMAAEFDVVNTAYRDANKRAIVTESVTEAAVEMVSTVCIASALLWASAEHGTGHVIEFATIVVFFQYLRQFFEPLNMLTQRYTILQSGLAASERIFQFLDTTEVEPADAAQDPAPSSAPSTETFALDHVGFAYREGRPVLHDVSFTAHAGERIAIVGPTGAGKSTLTQLLLRLYDVDAGAIRVKGRDVRAWPRRELRRAFSVVPQEVTIFSGTLLENIALGEESPDRARAQAALDRLGIAEFFLHREGGLDARVDERGLNFSLGERQLLAFARAVYHDASIVLLDEATASVDSATEARIQCALEGLMAGRTSLVIAHRLSTIESADRILVFQGGRIVESGKHAELIAHGGLYARLHSLQIAQERSTSAA